MDHPLFNGFAKSCRSIQLYTANSFMDWIVEIFTNKGGGGGWQERGRGGCLLKLHKLSHTEGSFGSRQLCRGIHNSNPAEDELQKLLKYDICLWMWLSLRVDENSFWVNSNDIKWIILEETLNKRQFLSTSTPTPTYQVRAKLIEFGNMITPFV